MAIDDSLLSPTTIILFGRLLPELKLDFNEKDYEPGKASLGNARPGANRFLLQQLGDDDAQFARIYGYSYEGQYYEMARPTVFLVHGDGFNPEVAGDEKGKGSKDSAEEVRAWAYDKADLSMRLDIDSGPLDQLLLEAEIALGGEEAYYSGAHARISGAHARVSGAHARVSGAHARISGAHARIAGAHARVSGAHARLRGGSDD